MIERKPLLWFLAIAFTISWTLFLMPLALSGRTTSSQQFIRLGLWTLAMWGPGVGAIIATRQFAKQPFSILGLNTLGPKRFYLWALFLPTLLAIAAGVLTVLFGIARFGRTFGTIFSTLQIGAIVSVSLFGEIRQVFGSYSIGLWLLAAMCAVLILIFSRFRPAKV